MLLVTGAKKEAEPIAARVTEALTMIGQPARADALRVRLAGNPTPPP